MGDSLGASIVLDKLSKRYGSSKSYALKDVSLNVSPGEAYGFLGPNGAGKSTAIRTLLNFIQPTSGSATILGNDIVKKSVLVKKSVGYLSGDFAVYPKMTGDQYISYMGELQPPVSKRYVLDLVKRLRAEPNKRMGDLSRGNRQKFGIIQAFMHQPKVLILDEPTSGLDPLMQEEFYKLVAEAKARGAAIFMSSHILSEVQRTCDRVGIIRDGKLITEKIIADLAKEAAQTFDIVFEGKAPLSELKKIQGAHVTSSSDNSATVHLHGKLSDLFAVLAKHNVAKIEVRNVDLEDMFLGYYSDKAKAKK